MINTPCPPPHQLSDYLLGFMGEAESEGIEAHIKTCSACQDSLSLVPLKADALVTNLRRGVSTGEFDHEQALEEALSRISSIDSLKRPRSTSREALPASDEWTSDSEELSVRPMLGPYRLSKVLGNGGMGRVYLAQHSRLEMTVAIKVLADHLTSNPHAIARFDREIKAVGRLNHPNIVRATDAGDDSGTRYLVMEFVTGLDVARVINRVGPLNVSDACEVIRQAAIGIHHAHDHQLIHRDLKPSNLMITHEGIVKVLDLGLARLHTQQSEGLTSDFQLMGTADYMAPEQALNILDTDARADIYSLGCTLYTLLSGRPPFSEAKHSTTLRKLIAHEQEEPTSICVHRPDVPTELADILNKSVAKSPEDRFATAEELANALRQFAAGARLAELCEAAALSDAVDEEMLTDTLKNAITTDTVKLRSDKPDHPVPPPNRASRPQYVIALVALLAIAILAAGVILNFTTALGTFVVEVNGDHIKTSIGGQKLVIEDQQSGETYFLTLSDKKHVSKLTPGFYNIRVEGEDSGLDLETDQFRITRRGTTVVKAFYRSDQSSSTEKSTANAVPDSPANPQSLTEKAFAEWAIEHSAIVSIQDVSGLHLIEDIAALPSTSFDVVALNFTTPLEIDDQILAILQGSSSLFHLEFQELELSDKTIAGLATLPELSILRLRYDETHPLDLTRLVRLQGLQDLTLGGYMVGDGEVVQLPRLKSLQNLTIAGREVTDASLQHIGKMRNLEFLSLMFTKINGSGLVHLKDLKKLWSLHLPYNTFNPEGLAVITSLPRLSWLNLGYANMEDIGLTHVTSSSTLEILELTEGKITGEGLDSLAPIASLRKLKLEGTLIVDADIDRLAALTQLTSLSLGDCLSPEAVEQLRARLPHCEITTLK